MKYGELLEFRKDLYFEGAVQIDWFYDQSRASKVAENFVFHGKNYFGIEDDTASGKKRIDTITLVSALTSRLHDDAVKVPELAIADYGTGKSHLAVTLGQLYSGPEYMPVTFNKILENISSIDPESAEIIRKNCDGNNFVMVVNGMRDFNLHSEILRAAQRSLHIYGLSDDCLKKLNRAIESAELFFSRNVKSSITKFEESAVKFGWNEKGTELEDKIRRELLVNEKAFEIINDVYKDVTGQEIRWDEGLSASAILEMLITELCGFNGKFDHIIILFDEFGRYLEYASGVNAVKSGDSALQQIFEVLQNSDGVLQMINFIQSDIKTYLQRIDQTKNISRYIGRYDGSEKYYISSNLETVFANLIKRIDKDAFKANIIDWQSKNEGLWKVYYEKLNKWLITKGMWKNYKLFRKVVVEGVFPMHPLSTFMLTQLSDYLQNRSSLTLISRYIEELSDVELNDSPYMIMPEQLMRGDLYIEMLAAEQDGKQPSQQCIRYDNILRKFGDKLSEKSHMVLRANLILRILRFRTLDYNDVKDALSFASGLSVSEIENELVWLENEYAVLGFDDHAGCFDFMEESNGAHDFKVLKKRLMAAADVSAQYINDLKIQQIAGILDVQSTNFGTSRRISTNEWQFAQEMYPIEEFTKERAELYISEWSNSTSSVSSKGKLIWLYVNKFTAEDYIKRAQLLSVAFTGKPIVIMLLNDDENRLYNCLVEYNVFDTLDDLNRKKYKRHFIDGFKQAENNLKDEFESLKKQRLRISSNEIIPVSQRMAIYLTTVFDEIYPNAVPFWFDGFVTKANNLSGKGGTYYCSIIKMLLSGTVNSDSIHNFASDVRNRIEAVLMTNSNTSWKCINEQYHIIPPENAHAKKVYEEIAMTLNKEGKLSCQKVYDTYSMPPYGMSEDIITLMIAVVCANLNYCLRFSYNGVITNISAWKDLVVKKDKKIETIVIKQTDIIVVDAGEVVNKYKRLFSRIQDNKLITEIRSLTEELEQMIVVDDVPVELETEYLLAKNNLDRGTKAQAEWNEKLRIVRSLYNDAIDNKNLYNALKALENLRELPVKKCFSDNGFDFDKVSERKVNEIKSDLTTFINGEIDTYVENMYCKDVEHLTTFRNHNNKMIALLDGLGFQSYAKKVNERKNQELANVEEIRSRQELKDDCKKYLEESIINRSTSYVTIKDQAKRGKELQARILKYGSALGKDGATIQNRVDLRVQELIAAREHIDRDITEIWDDLPNVMSADDIQGLIERINIVLQKGLEIRDSSALDEIKKNLEEFIIDIKRLYNAEVSRVMMETVSEELRIKYRDSDFDFEVADILEGIIQEVIQKMDNNDTQWKRENLSLGDKTRDEVHKWKEKIRYLPEYLSDSTLHDVEQLDKEADEIIKIGKIDDVIFYFEKLTDEEKSLCLEKLKCLI